MNGISTLEMRLRSLEKDMTEVKDALAVKKPPATIVEKYEGQRIRVFLENGVIVTGDAHFDGNWADVVNNMTRKSALCNMSKVVSITRDV